MFSTPCGRIVNLAIKEKLISETTVKTTVQTSTPSGTTTNLVSLSNYSNTAVFAANKILPSIVGIQVTYTTTTNSIFGFGMPTTSEATATGSGIIVSEDGYIVTNNHVISSESSSYFAITEATGIKVNLYGGNESYDATIIGTDAYIGLKSWQNCGDLKKYVDFIDNTKAKILLQPPEKRYILTVISYIKIARFDHWIKQLFVIPGIVFAFFMPNRLYGVCKR